MSHYRFSRDREIMEYIHDQHSPRTPKEVATIVGVSVSTVYRAMRFFSAEVRCKNCGEIVSCEMTKVTK